MRAIVNLFKKNAPASVKISKPFTIFRDEDVYAMFPNLALVPGGVLLSFRIAPREPIVRGTSAAYQQHLHPRSALALTKLDANFRAGPIRLFDADLFASDQDPNLTRLSNGSLMMTSFSWRPVFGPDIKPVESIMISEKLSGAQGLFWGGFASISKDDGEHWGPRQYLPALPEYPDIVPGKRPWHGGRHRGQLVELSGGRLLLPSYDRVPGVKAFCSYLHVSPDFGKTWKYGGVMLRDPTERIGYAEPTLFALRNGTLLALHRTFGAKDNLTISRSRDEGKTWSQPEFSEVIGHPYQVVSLPSGAAMLIYGVRHAPYSIRGRLIDARNGEIGEEELVFQSGSEVRDIGYPAGIAVGENMLLVVYYWVDFSGTRYIEGVTVQLD